VIVHCLRQVIPALVLLVLSSAAHAEGRDNLPVALVPNIVDLDYDARAVFASSGSLLVVTDEAAMYAWDVASGRLVRRIIFDDFAKVRVLTPNEDMMIASQAEGKLQLWSLAAGAQLGVLREKIPDRSFETTAMTVSADGTLLVAAGGSENNTISVWNLKTRERLRSFEFGKEPEGTGSHPIAVHLTADMKRLIVATKTSVRTFDFASGKRLTTFDLPNEKWKRDYSLRADSIASDDGVFAQLTAPDCDIAELRYLDLKDPANPITIDKPADCKRPKDSDSSFLGDLSLFANPARSTVLIARSGMPELTEWDLKSHTKLRTIKWPKDAGTPIGVDKDFRKVVTKIYGDDYSGIAIRELETGTVVATLATRAYSANAAIPSRDGKSILLSQRTADGKHLQFSLWEVGAAEPTKILQIADDNDIEVRDFSLDAKLIAVAEKDSFALLSLDTGKEVRRFAPKEIKEPWHIRLSPDGKLAVLTGEDQDENTVALLVDTSDGSIKKQFEQAVPGTSDDDRRAAVTDATFSLDGKRLALGRFNGSAEIWTVNPLKQLKLLPVDKDNDPGQIWSPIFYSDGKKLLVCSRDSGAFLWTIDSGKRPRAFLFDDYAAMHSHFGSAALSHDGSTVVAGASQHAISSGDSGRERSLKTYSAATGKLRRSWLAHEDVVRAVTFSQDDRMIVSAGGDGTIRYSDAESGKVIATILVSNDGHWAVLSSSGLFSGNLGETGLFNVTRGLLARPASDFRAQLDKPDLIAELLKGDPGHRYAAAARQLDLQKVWNGLGQ
jgi:WD40 repeat protein